MLMRLQECMAIVKWHLRNGQVLPAISLCTKKGGQWRPGLNPGKSLRCRGVRV